MRSILHELTRVALPAALAVLFSTALLRGAACRAEATEPAAGLDGAWVIDEKESDDTDREIEKAVHKSGGTISSEGKKGKGRYKGGPPEQEIYDHLAYDDHVTFAVSGPQIRITYEDGFERTFFTDGRGREVSASGSSSGDRVDFSFGSWDGQRLHVEARPRDGGWTRENYSLQEGGTQLRVEMTLKPLLFSVPLDLVRVFNRPGPGK